jgi:hypothetical protein
MRTSPASKAEARAESAPCAKAVGHAQLKGPMSTDSPTRTYWPPMYALISAPTGPATCRIGQRVSTILRDRRGSERAEMIDALTLRRHE